MRTLLQDLRYGVRMLAKNPGFTTVAILTLALGIGGNATVFSWIRGVLLNPLPGIVDAKRVVAVESIMLNGEYHTSSFPDYRDYRDRNHVFDGLIGFEMSGVDMSLRNDAPPERVWGIIATENYFDFLGAQAAIGRTFHAEPNQALNSDPYIVLGHGLWKRRFGSDPNVVGRTVNLNGHPFTVIGVMPRTFYGTIVGINAEYFVPMMMQPQILPTENIEERYPTFVHIMGRLKPGVTIAQAQAELSTLAIDFQKEYPNAEKGVGVYVAPVWKAHYGVQDFLRSVLGFLMIVAMLVLLIACVNVANLLLARATVREKEIAVRAALGAGRGRLIRQLLLESLLMALAGGGGRIFLALWGVNLLGAFVPPAHLPIGLGVDIDGTVLLFTLILSVVTGIVFGLAPALQISRTNLNESLKAAGRTSGTSAGGHRLRDVLVVSEMVLATVLLVAAGLLLRSLRRAEEAGPGFNTNQMTLPAFYLHCNGYSDGQAIHYYDRLLERIRAYPGIQSASLERYVPLWFTGRSYSTARVEGYTPKPNEDMGIDLHRVGPDSFLYLAELQADGTDANILVRSQRPTPTVIGVVRAAAKSEDSKVQPLETDNLDSLLKVSMFANRTAASLASVLGILGTLLAALGIYGVLSYNVNQRVREIGIRMALGAQRKDVLGLVIGQGLRLAVIGMAIGTATALLVTHWMSSLLFGVSATDPATFASVAVVVTAVAALGAYVPAHRAMGVDPMVALRYE